MSTTERETLQLEICAPDRSPAELDVREVIVPGSEGVFAVLPGHTAFLSTLKAGVLVAYDTKGQQHSYALNGGFSEVLEERVVVLTLSFESSDDIDIERARAARARAEERLSKREAHIDVARAEAALARALARIHAHSGEGY